MKIYVLTLFLITIISCTSSDQQLDSAQESSKVEKILNEWHKSAAENNFDSYFEAMDDESIFFGTDASENWTKQEFKSFSKPHFDKGEAWNFEAFERNIYFSERGNVAWFDELLDTWMGTCVGSGVLEIIEGEWKIKHYVLSVAIPNADMQEVIDIKHENDSIFQVNR